MRIPLTVHYVDGTSVEVETRPASIMRWERASGRRMSDLGEGVGMEDILRLAWETLRLDSTVDPFDRWVDRVADVDIGGDRARPTGPGPSDG
jgi:hypothetical protein